MNTQIYFDAALVVLTPLSVYLAVKYVKEHASALHESMRKLLTDSAAITRATLRESKEDLDKGSLKDHGDTRVFLERISGQAEKLAASARSEAKDLLINSLATVKADAHKVEEKLLDALAAAEKSALKMKEEAATRHSVIQKSLTSVQAELRNAILEAKLSVEHTVQTGLSDTMSLSKNLHEEAALAAGTMHDEVREAVWTGLEEAGTAATKAKEEILESHSVLQRSFTSAAATIKVESAQATRDRLNLPTPVVQCSVCKLSVVKYTTDAEGTHICANCQPKV